MLYCDESTNFISPYDEGRKTMSSAKRFAISFAVCLVLFSVIGYLVSSNLEKALFEDDTTIYTGNEKDYGTDIQKTPVTEKETKTLSAVIIGKDLDTNLSDAILVVKADKGAKKLLVSSIPTDSRYAITGTDSDGNEYTGSMSFKETYSIMGVDYLVDKIYAITNIKPDFYAVVNSHAAQTLVNELYGNTGVVYTVSEEMKYEDTVRGANIDLPEGTQYLDGEESVQLMRYRSYKSGNGDVKRCSTQVEFIRELIKGLKPEHDLKSELLNESKRKKLLSYLVTNMSQEQLYDNLDILFSLSEYEFVSVPFRYNPLIKPENISSIHADFNTPFKQ